MHGLKDLESQFKVFDDQAQERTTNQLFLGNLLGDIMKESEPKNARRRK